MTDIPALIARLRPLIDADERSQNAIGDAAGIARGQLSRLMAGKITDPSLDYLEGLAGVLGVGLAELLGEDAPDAGPAVMVPHNRIQPVEQPRTVFDAAKLAELAESISDDGIIAPLLLTTDRTIIAGERRWRAARILIERGEHPADWELPCVIRAGVDAEQHLVLSLVENVQREDLTPLEEAAAFAELRDDHGWDTARIAAACAKTVRWVEQRLTLMRLGDAARAAMTQGLFGPAAARHIARLVGPDGAPDEACQQSITDKIRAGDLIPHEDRVRVAVGAALSKPKADRTPPMRPDDWNDRDEDEFLDEDPEDMETGADPELGAVLADALAEHAQPPATPSHPAPAPPRPGPVEGRTAPPSPSPLAGEGRGEGGPDSTTGSTTDNERRSPEPPIHRDQIAIVQVDHREGERWPARLLVISLGDLDTRRTGYIRADLVVALGDTGEDGEPEPK